MLSPSTWATADRAVRELAPRALDALGCRDQAAILRALEPLVDKRTAGDAAHAAGKILDQLRPVAIKRRHAMQIGDWAHSVAYAAERGREGVVLKRAASLEALVDAVLVRHALTGEADYADS